MYFAFSALTIRFDSVVLKLIAQTINKHVFKLLCVSTVSDMIVNCTTFMA